MNRCIASSKGASAATAVPLVGNGRLSSAVSGVCAEMPAALQQKPANMVNQADRLTAAAESEVARIKTPNENRPKSTSFRGLPADSDLQIYS